MGKETIMGVGDQYTTIPISNHFAKLMLKLEGEDIPELSMAATFVSRHAEDGHICIDLSSITGESAHDMPCPALPHWIKILRNTSVVGRPGEFKPLILDERGRLYLYRYWEYEKILSDILKVKVVQPSDQLDVPLVKEGLKRLFPESSTNGSLNWQKIAAFIAVYKNFCVISGGPGTGKTHTIVKVMTLLLEQAKDHKLRIALITPTGKAAARLKESIRATKGTLDCSERIRAMIPEEVSTIHRILGTLYGSCYFRYNEKNQLPYEVIIVDEASMVDLPLMAKLVRAIPPQSRLILCGDKDQLASVEAGAVLGDICGSEQLHYFSDHFVTIINEMTEESVSPKNVNKGANLLDSIVQLKKNYRFGSDSGITIVSDRVRAGDGAGALNLLKQENMRDIAWRRCPEPEDMAHAIANVAMNKYTDYLRAANPKEALSLFSRFCILCALRKGPYGITGINNFIERALQKTGLIPEKRLWYRGQPIMISRNNYQMGLFNGDIGIIWPDPDAGCTLRAYFTTPDDSLRKVLPSRLPEYELVYAMTVHKSQGSEFDQVLLLLPDRDVELLTGELIYTGITRARKNVEIWGREEIFLAAAKRRIKRQSGLRDALWEKENE